MPKRTDLKSILIIGSGPIVIGQACEFDYSGVQACKALKEDGYRVILVNSNPATIMTDPEFSDATYIEPLTIPILEKIIAKEKPCALLPTLGGQTGLNLSRTLAKEGILEAHGVELIGANLSAIEKGEDRELFRQAMLKLNLDIPESRAVHTFEEGKAAAEEIGNFPIILRPSYTLGGRGGGIAYNKEEFETILRSGLEASPTTEVLVEECLLGWKEYEMEVMRDTKDQCVVVCSIENVDAMGVHTGDSITVAPAMTLTDKEYQLMRDASFAVIREIGVETGGSNIQFAVNPENGRLIVIEMNPRVSRSSALASKATGFPIAKIAAKLAVGYTLDELQNDITRETPACFEPSIDYVVTKIPRFTFEKFANADTTLTSSMKSVGEAMAIGRTFKESFQKALRSLEVGAAGFGAGGKLGSLTPPDAETIRRGLAKPNAERFFYVRYALLAGESIESIHATTHIDPWFLHQFKGLVEMEKSISAAGPKLLTKEHVPLLKTAKQAGFTDAQLATLINHAAVDDDTSPLWDIDPASIAKAREALGINRVYRLVDTCAAEFSAATPYYYSTFEDENELQIGAADDTENNKEKIMIIGGGPNRIGQGIEFDYCCVHASFALREAGYESVMVNSNPETVSTDYDTSDHLFFEPLTHEDVAEIYKQSGCTGAIVQLGGQTPLNLAEGLKAAGVNILGTSPENIDLAEDRESFKRILNQLGLKQPINATAQTEAEAKALAVEIGFPLLLRPSFVLGGRGMFIVYTMEELDAVVHKAFEAAPGKPVLLDKFLEEAIELDVDALCDGTDTVICGMLEHIEYAGVHSGDATMVLPPHTLSEAMLNEVRSATAALASALGVKGLMNIQFAIKNNELYLLEVNPRASRTVPFISKAIGKPLAKYATRIMLGETLQQIGFTQEITIPYHAVKASVFPFSRFPGAAIALSPEMRSTGEVMGMDENFGMAFAKAQMAVSPPLPSSGTVFFSVKDEDKPAALEVATRLHALGFKLVSTTGTAAYLMEHGKGKIEIDMIHRVGTGARPNVIDLMKNGEIAMIINTPRGMMPHQDENAMRETALAQGICMLTTLTGAGAAVDGIAALQENEASVAPLQERVG